MSLKSLLFATKVSVTAGGGTKVLGECRYFGPSPGLWEKAAFRGDQSDTFRGGESMHPPTHPYCRRCVNQDPKSDKLKWD